MANIKQIEFSKIRDMPEWATDATKVEAFRQLLRDGKGLPSLRVREIIADELYEVIDGFHRYRALVLEDYTSYPGTVETSDDRTAELDRIQASLTQPADVLMQRGIHALRNMFLRDMLGFVSGNDLLRIRLCEHGTLTAEPRRRALPHDPIETMLIVSNHFAAKSLQNGVADNARPGAWWDTATQDWERRFLSWFDDVSYQLQCPKATIFDYLGFGLIPVEAGGQQIGLWFRQLLRFGDEDVQRTILKRIRTEHLVPDGRTLGRIHAALETKPASASQIITVLGEWPLEDVPRRLQGKVQTPAERENEQQAQFKRLIQGPDIAPMPTAIVREDDTPQSVFTIVSPNFTAQPPSRQIVGGSLVVSAANRFLDACSAYDDDGGAWDETSVQAALNRVLELVQNRLQP